MLYEGITYYIAHDIISSLGFRSDENAKSLFANQSGIKKQDDTYFLPDTFCASRVDDQKLEEAFRNIQTEKES